MIPAELVSQMKLSLDRNNGFDIFPTTLVATPNDKTHQLMMRWVTDGQGKLTCQWYQG